MELIIDNINDTSKKEWLLNTLKLMGINFHSVEKRQTLEEYNKVTVLPFGKAVSDKA